MIEFKNYSCSYDAKSVLENINFQIPSHLALLGSNGSGKSTLMKSLCKLVKYRGKVYLDAKDVQEYDAKELVQQISYVPTKLEVYDEYISVEEYLLLSRFAYKQRFVNYVKKDYDLVALNLQLLNIAKLAKHKLSALSSGEASLVLIAAALTAQSKTIIFDEPTANLDPKNTKLISQTIKELKSTHNIIVITHNLELVTYLGIQTAFIQDKNLFLLDERITKDELVALYD